MKVGIGEWILRRCVDSTQVAQRLELNPHNGPRTQPGLDHRANCEVVDGCSSASSAQ